jgi:hypothetical protein
VARAIYAAAIQRSDLDWPEAVFEAYLQFEDIHGTVDSILQIRSKIAKETQRLARRREKQQEQLAAEYAVPDAPAVEIPAAVSEVPAQPETVEVKENPNSEAKRCVDFRRTILMAGIASILLCS